MADELETNVALEPEFQTFSDSDDDSEEEEQDQLKQPDDDVESDSDSQPNHATAASNSTLNDGDGDADADRVEASQQERKRARQEDSETTNKKEKKKQKLKEMKEKKRKKLQEEREAVIPLAKKTPEQQAETIWKIFLDKRGGSLSSLEKENTLKGEHLIDFRQRGTDVDADVLDIVKASVTYWEATRHKRTDTGEPSVIVVTSSARRAVSLLKSLSKIKCLVAKLFSKHMKLQEQRQFCSEKKFPLAVGTPNRIHKLLDIGVLKLSQAEAILFDVKKDVKGYDLFTQKDLIPDTLNLFQQHIFPTVSSTSTKMGLFGS